LTGQEKYETIVSLINNNETNGSILAMDLSTNLYERIGALQKLTASEAKIVDFLLRGRSEVAFETATSIGEKAGVSKASVVRLISRLGFASFGDFQKCLQTEIQERLDKPIERFRLRRGQTKDGKVDLLGQTIAHIMKNLQEAHDRIKPEQFEEAARLLALSKGAIYVAGNLSSFGLAQFFWYHAHYLRERVYLLDNLGSTLPHQLLDVTDQDILFLITHRVYSRQSQLVAEYFARRGRIIMLSDAEVNPFSHLASLILVAPSDSISLFDSPCAFMAVMEALIAAMDQLLEGTISGRFEVADSLWEHFTNYAFSPSPSFPKAGAAATVDRNRKDGKRGTAFRRKR
jgi:DNA-binding MurR/RpiR family transcriptional regulator